MVAHERLALAAGSHQIEVINEPLGFRTTISVEVEPGEVTSHILIGTHGSRRKLPPETKPNVDPPSLPAPGFDQRAALDPRISLEGVLELDVGRRLVTQEIQPAVEGSLLTAQESAIDRPPPNRIDFLGQDCRCLVMLPAAQTVRAHRCDDLGTHRPDHPDEVGQDGLASPEFERFVTAEGVAEVDGVREVLFDPIEPVGGQQFLRAQDGERVEQLRADLVLSSVAVTSTVLSPRLLASRALFSSSGCAVAIMKVPTMLSCRSTSPNSTRPAATCTG